MFLRSRSPLPTFLLSYHVWVTSKIQVNFRFNRYSKVLVIGSYRFSVSSLFMFSRSKNPFLTLLVSYHVWKIPKIQVNSRFKRISEVLIILSYEFLKFLHTIHVFEVEESIADIPTRLSYLGDLEKLGQLPVREILKETYDCVFWNFAISSIYMFSMSGNHLLTFLLCYNVWGPRKFKTTSGSEGFWEVIHKK